MRPPIRNRWAIALLLSALMPALVVTPALAGSGSNLDVGRVFRSAAAVPIADFGAELTLASTAASKPDGRIRLRATGYPGGTGYPGKVKTYKGPFIGNNVYNTTGARQTDVEATYGAGVEGSYHIFDISIQNDGAHADKFKVKAPGTGTAVKYFHGTTAITAAVVAGTYRTTSLAPGTTYLITAKVPAGGSITRLVTITSVADPTKKDAVKFGLKFVACGC
jgi:hypothetical protein